MLRNYLHTLGIAAFSLILLLACSGNSKSVKETENTPTSGKLTVYCDEGISKQLNDLAYTFNKLYPRAQINIKVCSEQEAIQSLFLDSTKVIALSRALGKKELEQFNKATIFPQQVFLARSAIALLAAKDNPDTVCSLPALQQFLKGDTTVFERMKYAIFCEKGTGIVQLLKDTFLQGGKIGANCYNAPNLNSLVQQVAEKGSLMGIINYAQISDKDDSLTKSLLNRVKILPLSKTEKGTYFFPDQSNIQTNDYCLSTPIYLFRRGVDFSLAAGFLSFVASDKGQIMMMKSGLAPAKQPERVVEITMEP